MVYNEFSEYNTKWLCANVAREPGGGRILHAR